MHVLLFDAYGGGGVSRTVINLANHLVGRHEVELISLTRGRETPRFPIDPRVRVTVVRAGRADLGPQERALAEQPTALRPDPREKSMSRWTDEVFRRRLESIPAGILISTRPSLHLVAATYASEHLVRIGQEHSHFESRGGDPRHQPLLGSAIPVLDAFVVLTQEDAEDYRSLVPAGGTEVRAIPNALPWPVPDTPAPLTTKVVVSAGRLDRAKGHARMVRAFAPVARAHPDWQLHIYGAGPQYASLQSQIAELGLESQILLRGYTHDFRDVLEQASIYALTSHSEGFSMVLTEAMSVGVPPVAMDCPRGPRQIITTGRNGLLVPDGDEAGFADALNGLIEDQEFRRRLGAQAQRDARAYEIGTVGAQWERLFDDLTARRS